MARTPKSKLEVEKAPPPAPPEQVLTDQANPSVNLHVVEEMVTVHGEACLSANARLTDPYGVEWQLTIREGVTFDMFDHFAAICPYISKTLLAAEWTIYGARPVSGKSPTEKRLSPGGDPATGGPPPEEKPAPKKLSPAETRSPTRELLGDSFEVTKLAMHWTDDHSQWFLRVFGGKYRKYGVRCWPEVAADFQLHGLDLDALEVVGAQYDVSDFGFVVAFSRNDEGKVSKVTNIAQR